MPDIICLGEAMVEFNQRPDGLLVQGFGGDTSNCAISAARQDATVAYITRVGDDHFGKCLIDLWSTENIDTSQVVRNNEASSGIYFVTHDADGHHFSYYRKQSAAAGMSPKDISENFMSQAKILHVSAISQAISSSATDTVFHAIEVANQNHTKVAYDTNLRLNLWPLDRARATIHEAMKHCQIALPSYDDAQVLTGLNEPDDIADFYLKLGAETTVLKLGSRGVLVATHEKRQMIDAISVNSVDATGAGDTFAGALLAEHCTGKNLFEAAQHANIAAALSTTRSGAVNAIPTRQQVEAFLMDQ
ncbi:MAG: 2-dehydro-3-deoxygluconokinase [Gammaproteobacteria bacterium]|jgi:2-dehydro-3-deoxygluconokinase